MSRGPGKWQKAILMKLEEIPYFRLWQLLPDPSYTPSEYSALHRAAKQLEKTGFCVTLILWAETFTGENKKASLITFVARPDYEIDGKPIKSISVEAVPNGTGSTFMSSLRYIGEVTSSSKSTIARSLNEQKISQTNQDVVNTDKLSQDATAHPSNYGGVDDRR